MSINNVFKGQTYRKTKRDNGSLDQFVVIFCVRKDSLSFLDCINEKSMGSASLIVKFKEIQWFPKLL